MKTEETPFLDELLITAGFDPENDDFELLKADLEPVLDERVMLRVYEALSSDEDRATFDGFMDNAETGTEEEFITFLQSTIPNLDDVIAQVHVEFQEEYLEAMKAE